MQSSDWLRDSRVDVVFHSRLLATSKHIVLRPPYPILSSRSATVNSNSPYISNMSRATSAITSAASHRVVPSANATTSRLTTSARGLATVQDAPPVQHKRGLQDQDRIFQNLYGHHGADLKSAMKYGDWHKTKEIINKGHDWVRIATHC
jgi:hypothetical protein